MSWNLPIENRTDKSFEGVPPSPGGTLHNWSSDTCLCSIARINSAWWHDARTMSLCWHYARSSDYSIYLSLVSRLSQPQRQKASLRYQKFNWVLLHVRIVAVLLITFFPPFNSLCTKVLVFYNYTPRLVENAYFLWIMLNTGKHRKCVSIGENVLLIFHAPL